MANSGVDTNKSQVRLTILSYAWLSMYSRQDSAQNFFLSPSNWQFFITYAKQPSLDGKYTIFGRVIDGLDSTLDLMEKVPVNPKSRPLQDITLQSVTIHANPVSRSGTTAKAQ